MRRRARVRQHRLVIHRAVAVGVIALGAGSAVGAGLAGAAMARPTAAPTVALGGASAHCPANLADELKSTGSARQLVTLDAARSPSTFALLTTWKRRGACWARVAGPFTSRIGVNGISAHKVEGDGTTPAGAFGIGPVIYGNGPDPGVRYPYHHLVCGDWWDEDPSSRWYNSFKHIACGSYPSWTGGDSEALWTETTAYQSFAWIEYNTDPVVPGRGSAIFLHDNIGTATTGCVTLAPATLDKVLDWLRPSDRPRVVIGTDATIRGY
ncbi:MAG TPA: L,D-transpeptidase family protein [Acidimicrobiales bacterium]|nr:L,D-transpeptidase family protein [Acidimicrobiales bacterium]